MKLEQQFTVPAGIDTVWEALLDPERVAPCFPGATITSVDGEEFEGIVKVRLGPISLQYRGKGRFTGIDEAAHSAVIEASGNAAGGQGTAAATVHASLAENGEGTMVTVVTDLTVTGKPAQFGRGLIEDVSHKILGQFADCLSTNLAPPEKPEPAAETVPDTPAQKPVPSEMPPTAPVQAIPPLPVSDEIDLLDAAGGAVAKRAIPAVAVLVLLGVLIRMWRARRRA